MLDITILGAGSAAFAAALRASEQGARVTLVAPEPLGGTCVNVGCVPSKILVAAARTAHLASRHPFAGVPRGRGGPIDASALLAQRHRRVEELRRAKYEELLASDPRLVHVPGKGRFVAPGTLRVELAGGGERTLTPDRVLVATGASPFLPPIPGLAATPFWTSTEALAAPVVPRRLIVLGGGFIACELAQAFARLGASVAVLARSTLLSEADPALGEALAGAFAAEGIEVLPYTVPSSVEHRGGEFRLETAAGPLTGSHLLVATGRRPATAGLGLDGAGVGVDAEGAVLVDERLRTTAPGVWAAGDCTALPRLVYVAAAAGTRAAVDMTGGDGEAVPDLGVIPVVVFTDPQAAWVGLDVATARRQGLDVEERTLPLDQVPRPLVEFDTRGFVRLVARTGDGKLLGAQILAPGAGEAVQTVAVAIAAGWTVDDLAGRLFPYLTLVEGLKLTAQTFTRDVGRLSCCAG